MGKHQASQEEIGKMGGSALCIQPHVNRRAEDIGSPPHAKNKLANEA
jgi:hypothetical protein